MSKSKKTTLYFRGNLSARIVLYTCTRILFYVYIIDSNVDELLLDVNDADDVGPGGNAIGAHATAERDLSVVRGKKKTAFFFILSSIFVCSFFPVFLSFSAFFCTLESRHANRTRTDDDDDDDYD